MKKRSALSVFIFGIITLGFYSWYWEVKTKGEMNKRGEHIPTAWIWLIPFVGYLWWAWKYSEGAGHVTKEQAPAILVFLLFLFTGPIGDAIVQHYFNQVPDGAPAGTTPPPATETAEAPATPPVSTPPTEQGPAIPTATDTPPEEETPKPPAGPLVQ